MEENKMIGNTELTEKEIKESLTLLKLAIQKKIFAYEHADPTKENCYISSGYISGVYFPNSEIIQLNPMNKRKHPNYKVDCIGKYKGELGVYYSLREDNNINPKIMHYFDTYIFEPFQDLIYDYHYNKIIKKIDNDIKYYKEDLELLQRIKRVYKKNGENFAKVLQNFTGANLYFSFSILSSCVSSVQVNGRISLYRTNENREKSDTPTVDEVEQLINQEKEKYHNWINDKEKAKKDLSKNFAKFQKIIEELKKFSKSVPNWYDFQEEIKSMLI